MTLTTPAGTGALASTRSQPLRKDAHRAEFAGTGNFGRAGLDADWTMWMEYDGLTVATVTLKPAPAAPTCVDSPCEFRCAATWQSTCAAARTWG